MSALVESLYAANFAQHRALQLASFAPLNQLRDLAHRLGSSESVELSPPPSDVDWQNLIEWLGTHQQPRALAIEVWKKVPQMLWRTHGGQALAMSPRLRDGVAWAASQGTSRVAWVHAVADAYLSAEKGVPTDCLKWLGELLQSWCDSDASARLDAWRERHLRLQMFSPFAFSTQVLLALYASPQLPLSKVLDDVRLTSSRSRGHFSHIVFDDYLAKPVSDAKGYAREHLDRVIAWVELLVPDLAEWSAEMAAIVINGLLEPWASPQPPSIELQKTIKKQLEDWFGALTDTWPKHWRQASPTSRSVLERWKILDVMEDYFARVDEYARQRYRDSGDDTMQRHWMYRRPFWLAYYKKGVVTKARALIGRGLEEASQVKGKKLVFGKSVARLSSRISKHHCGLLLEINGMLVIDLSHSGKAYFFLQGSSRAPSTDALNYDRDHLDDNFDEAMSHQASEDYGWQGRFAEYIYRHTRVYIKQAEYLLLP